MKALFPLGQVVATPGAIETLQSQGVSPLALIRRHVSGDWSDMDPEDRQRNSEALTDGSRVFSAYIQEALALVRQRSPDKADIDRVDQLLRAALGDTDRFWLRWTSFRGSYNERTGTKK